MCLCMLLWMQMCQVSRTEGRVRWWNWKHWNTRNNSFHIDAVLPTWENIACCQDMLCQLVSINVERESLDVTTLYGGLINTPFASDFFYFWTINVSSLKLAFTTIFITTHWTLQSSLCKFEETVPSIKHIVKTMCK